MATKSTQESLLELWESIPEDLRTDGPCTFDALSSSIASLVAEVQANKDDLSYALLGHSGTHLSWQNLMDYARARASCLDDHDLRLLPPPFTGAASDYQRWKHQIRLWASMYPLPTGEKIVAAAMLKMTGLARSWTLSRDACQYSMVDGTPVSGNVALKALFKDMDLIFLDRGAGERALRKYKNVRQGKRPVSQHNTYFFCLVCELGYDNDDSMVIQRYIDSLRDDLRVRMEDWHLSWTMREQEPVDINFCMQKAALLEGRYPAPKKGYKRRTKKKTSNS